MCRFVTLIINTFCYFNYKHRCTVVVYQCITVYIDNSMVSALYRPVAILSATSVVGRDGSVARTSNSKWKEPGFVSRCAVLKHGHLHSFRALIAE